MPPQNPVVDETHAVQAAQDSSRTITIGSGMVWYNIERTKGIRFPPGTYVLEAQDANYWYFRSPTPLEFRVFNGDRVADERTMPGGLMLVLKRIFARYGAPVMKELVRDS
jgi:hypothetical protein